MFSRSGGYGEVTDFCAAQGGRLFANRIEPVVEVAVRKTAPSDVEQADAFTAAPEFGKMSVTLYLTLYPLPDNPLDGVGQRIGPVCL